MRQRILRPLWPFLLVLAVSFAGLAGMESAWADKTQVFEMANYTFNPNNVVLRPGERMTATAKNLGGFHDLVFELDNGRIVSTSRMTAGMQETISFDAPLEPGPYVFYCSVGQHRRQGMEGELYVEEEGGTPLPTLTPRNTAVPQPTRTITPTAPAPTAVPGAWPVVADGLKNPRGLTAIGDFLLVSEGGTGPAPNGQFQAGNGDGRVTGIGLANPATQRFTLVDGLTNAMNPGGGLVGANHASIPGPLGPTSTGYALLSGGAGHPDPKAQLLRVTFGSPPTAAADFFAFEQANNPDGVDAASGGIDSNPWRMVQAPGGSFFVTDAGANDVLLVNPTTGVIKLWGLLAPVGSDSAGSPIQAVPTGLVMDAKADDPTLYVSLLGSFAPGEAQVRKLHDNNADGDALDEGENTLVADGLTTAVDLAMTPAGLFVLEFGGFSAQGRLSRVGADGEVSLRVEHLNAASAMAMQSNGDLLVATAGMTGTWQTDRVIRIPLTSYAHADELPSTMPTATPTPVAPTPTPVQPMPTATPVANNPTIYLPVARRD